jgi:hypothetical protein
MERFAFDIHTGLEPRAVNIQNYLIRQGDEEKPTFELPLVPEKFRTIFASPPMIGIVQRVNRDWQVTILLGKQDGIRKGMLFTDSGPEMMTEYEVKHVDLHWALLDSSWTDTIREIRNAKKGDPIPPAPETGKIIKPHVGLRLYTHQIGPEVEIY